MEKEYYTLDEAQRLFNLSFDDVVYLIQQAKITPIFYVEPAQYVIGTWEHGSRFVGHGVAWHKGLLCLSHNDQLTLIRKGRVRALEFGIGNINDCYNWDIRYPFKTVTPNEFVAEWQPLSQKEAKLKPACARLVPKEEVPMLSIVGDIFESFAELSLKHQQRQLGNEQPAFKPRDSKTDSEAELVIKDRNHLFKKEHILILRRDLEQQNIIPKANTQQSHIAPANTKPLLEAIQPAIETNSEPVTENTQVIDAQYSETRALTVSAESELSATTTQSNTEGTAQPPKKQTRSNQLTELLERIVSANPTISAKQAWRVIETEVELETDERLYDIDGILKDVTNSEIAWQSRYGNSSITKLSTFDAAVSRVRKRLNAN